MEVDEGLVVAWPEGVVAPSAEALRAVAKVLGFQARGKVGGLVEGYLGLGDSEQRPLQSTGPWLP